MSSVATRLPEPELPPSPPCEQAVQRSLQESTEYPPLPMHHNSITGPLAIRINEASDEEARTMTMAYHHGNQVFWQSGMPTSYPMEIPSQEVTTPTNTADDESSRVGSSSPSWSPSPQRRAPATRARQAKSPREKKARPRKTGGGRGNTGGVAINAPMSQSTKHLTHIPIKDMCAWAHRSEEERREQAEKKQSIPRPMNAFMMYRLAFSNRAKEFLNVKNYQIVNTAIAQSWALEPDDVRNWYNEMSKIERDNHQRTHPTYKFRPNRGPAFAPTRVTGPATPPPTAADTFESDSVAWSDGEYGSPHSFHHHHHDRSQSLDTVSDYHSRDSTPFDPSVDHSSSYSWNSFPSATMPTIQPSALHGGLGSQVEDVHYHRSSPVPGNVQYDLSNGLAGLPGSTHHELLQTQASHIPEGNLDPQMLSYPESQHMNMQPAFAPVANPYPVWGEEDAANNCYLTSSPHPGSATASPGPPAYHQQLGSYAMQRNPSWEASQHDLKDVADQWIDM